MDLRKGMIIFFNSPFNHIQYNCVTKEKYKYNSGLIQTHYMLYAIVTIVLLALKTIIGHFG